MTLVSEYNESHDSHVICKKKGENLWQTAIRETFEETGIRTEFVSLLTFRHMHDYKWGIDDMFFACLLRPLNLDIKINPDEIAAGKWVNVSCTSHIHILFIFHCATG